MEKICPGCENLVAGEDAKGDGMNLVYYCMECGTYVEERRPPTRDEAIDYWRDK